MKLVLRNPLLEKLPNFETFEEINEAITYHPFENINVAALNIVEKISLLAGEKVMLFPTKKIVISVLTWYGMLKKGLQNRNPIYAENKKRYFEYLELDKKPNNLPKHPTSGVSVNVLKGPPGTGKTVTIQRFCALLPQVIEHGKDEDAGWVYLKQLVYLHINLSHDGSRGGFLYAILLALDEALGTQYASTIPKQNRTVEKLAVATIARLIAHFTGIIFIDEAQLRNLVKSGQAELMQMFLLQLINTGIPIVLCGNERAFDWLNYSQDLSRLGLTEIAHFHPIGALNEANWELEWKKIFQGIKGFYVLSMPPESLLECSKILFELSGGIVRLALILWTQAQNDCLYHRRPYVTPDDLVKVYLGYSYCKLKPLADGFRFKNAQLLTNYPDIDANFYKQNWQNNKVVEVAQEKYAPPSIEITSKSKLTKRRSEQSKFKSQQTTDKNKHTNFNVLNASLPHEDMRINGLINHNLAHLAEVKKKIEG